MANTNKFLHEAWGFIHKKNREVKTGAKPFRGLWAGYDSQVEGASIIIPFTRVGAEIKFQPIVVCSTVRLVDRFPLLDETESEPIEMVLDLATNEQGDVIKVQIIPGKEIVKALEVTSVTGQTNAEHDETDEAESEEDVSF
jgi:hypothetical protein